MASRATGVGEKPNVLFIAVDDLRPELGCYSRPLAKSPHIDRLASQGLRFNRAYCQEALCNPSRASLLTGLRPETLRVFDLVTHFRDKNPGVVTLPELFKKNGYRSISIGKIFHTTNGNHDDEQSWSEKPWRGPGRQSNEGDVTTKPPAAGTKNNEADHSNTLPYGAPECDDDALLDGKIAKQAITVLNRVKDERFFLAMGFHKPHLPFVAPKKYWDLHEPRNFKVAENPYLPKDAPVFASNDASELRRYKGVPASGPVSDKAALNLIHAYHACVSFTDAQVGRVLAELDRLGLRSRTIIVLWGDNGYQLGEHGTWTKRTNWEIATRVPLILSTPGQRTAGAVADALVELVDLYPTLAELCGLTPPGNLEGKSLVPLLEDPRGQVKPAAFSVYPKQIPGGGTGFGRALRNERYRLVEWSATGSDTKFHELYDHTIDADENVNLANRPENKTLLATLAGQFHARDATVDGKPATGGKP